MWACALTTGSVTTLKLHPSSSAIMGFHLNIAHFRSLFSVALVLSFFSRCSNPQDTQLNHLNYVAVVCNFWWKYVCKNMGGCQGVEFHRVEFVSKVLHRNLVGIKTIFFYKLTWPWHTPETFTLLFSPTFFNWTAFTVKSKHPLFTLVCSCFEVAQKVPPPTLYCSKMLCKIIVCSMLIIAVLSL